MSASWKTAFVSLQTLTTRIVQSAWFANTVKPPCWEDLSHPAVLTNSCCTYEITPHKKEQQDQNHFPQLHNGDLI